MNSAPPAIPEVRRQRASSRREPVFRDGQAKDGAAKSLDFLSRPEIERIQWRKLAVLLEIVTSANRFYAAKLSGGSAIQNLDEFREQVPLTTKRELIADQLAHPPYGTDLSHPFECYTRCHQTSGSTGVPLRWLDTPDSWQHLLDNWRQIFAAAGVGRGDRLFFAFSFGPFLGFWTAIESAQQLGCFCFPGGSMTSPARLKAMLDHRVTVLCCTPTYALHLGEVAQAESIDRSKSCLRRIIVAGEPGGSLPSTRARLAALWPEARVFDHYGMTEVGPATYECPAEPGVLHVIESAYLAEVLDTTTGAPTPAGETGELVLTTLDRPGSPLLRYRTGDLVRPRRSGRCACGRHELALEGGILGRTDDMVVVRGVNVFPSAVEEIVRGCGEVAEYRVRLDGRGPMTELSLEVEPAPECPDAPALARRLQQRLQDALSLRVLVAILPGGALPRFEMKSSRWVRTAH